MYTVRVVGNGTSVGQGCTVCTTSPCFYVQQVSAIATNTTIYVNGDEILGLQYSTTIHGELLGIIIPLKYHHRIDLLHAHCALQY